MTVLPRRRPQVHSLAIGVSLLLLVSMASAEEPAPGETVTPAPADTETFVNPIRVLPDEQPPGDWYAPADNPESAVPSAEERKADPLQFGYYLMELVDKGKYALDHRDYKGAIEIYRTMTKAVPERAIGWGRLCEAYQKAGMRKEAESTCARAVMRQGSTLDFHVRYFELVLRNRDGKLSEPDLKNLDIIVENLAQQEDTKLTAAQLGCELGARMEDAERLRTCTRVLNEKLPNDLFTMTHNWALAVAEQDRDAADTAVDRAEAAGLSAAFVKRMRDANENLIKRRPNAFLIAAISIVLLVGAVIVARLRKKRGVPAHA
jgi:hypothetical protein